MSRRPSSTLVRKRCYEHWKTERNTLICYLCKHEFDPKTFAWEAEHEHSRAMGGSDDPPNVKPCCAGKCQTEEGKPEVGHRLKTKGDIKRIAKSNRIIAKDMKFKRTKNPMPGSRASKFAKRYDRETGRWKVVRRSEDER